MKASIKFSVTQDDNSAFFDNVVEYSNMTRDDVVELEAYLVKFLAEMVEVGKKKAAGKK